MNAYELRQEARRERLLRIAEKFEREGNARYARAKQMADAIPFGQPILVGHHSEKRDRNFRARMRGNFDKAFGAMKAAKDYAAKADAVGSGGISSDDPDAVAKLREQLEAHQAAQRRMKAVNAAHKRYLTNQASLDKSDLSDADKELVRRYVPAYSFEPHPYPPYAIHNNSANIRRIANRIEHLTASADREQLPNVQCAGFIVGDNKDANRIQVLFPGKPSEAVRSILKRNGFKWNRQDCCWQRMWAGGLWHWLTAPDGYLRKELEAAMAKEAA